MIKTDLRQIPGIGENMEQHLKCYASQDDVEYCIYGEPVDPRWDEKLRGEAKTAERLEGKWAVSAGYGMDISRCVESLLNT